MLFCLVVGVALAVGVYAIRDPNGMNLGCPGGRLGADCGRCRAVLLGLGIRAQRREARRALFVAGLGAGAVALMMLGTVALLLSFNQT